MKPKMMTMIKTRRPKMKQLLMMKPKRRRRLKLRLTNRILRRMMLTVVMMKNPIL
jgi:hypothetical protein